MRRREACGLSLATSEVRPISWREAASVIERYEPMPAQMRLAFGIFFGGVLGGAVVYSDEYAENLGVWDRYGYSGRIICLSRGACLPWTPKGSASRLIRRSMRLLPACFQVVTATVDPHKGEVGTIYQACAFDFAPMGRHGGRYRAGGTSSRTLRRRGLGNRAAILAACLKPRYEHRKGRYFAFRGPAAVRKRHRAAIEHLIRPYPKR